jgi:hypothetical protein
MQRRTTRRFGRAAGTGRAWCSDQVGWETQGRHGRAWTEATDVNRLSAGVTRFYDRCIRHNEHEELGMAQTQLPVIANRLVDDLKRTVPPRVLDAVLRERLSFVTQALVLRPRR